MQVVLVSLPSGLQSEVVLVLHVGLCLAAQCVCQTPALLCCILGFALYTALALFTLLIALLELPSHKAAGGGPYDCSLARSIIAASIVTSGACNSAPALPVGEQLLCTRPSCRCVAACCSGITSRCMSRSLHLGTTPTAPSCYRSQSRC